MRQVVILGGARTPVGKFGGASFVLVYVAAVGLVGVPALAAEWALGRHTRRGPVGAFARAGIPFYLGGTSLIIVVNVTMDTVTQIQSHLIAHQYGDLIKKAKLKGGLRRG